MVVSANEVGVVLCSVGQRRDAGLVATGGNVADLKKAREAQVGGQDLFADGVQHLGLDALLLGGGDGGGKAFERQGERRVFGLLVGQLLDLLERLLQEVFGRDAMVFHADGHVGGDLVEGRGNGVEAGDPVVVVLDGCEAELGDELRIVRVDATHLVDGHLPLLELGAFLGVSEIAHQQFAAGLFLVREAGGVDGCEFEEKILLGREPLVDGLHGVVGDLVVVAVVADVGSELRESFEAGFPVVVKEVVEGFAAIFEGRRGRGGGEVLGGQESGGEQEHGQRLQGEGFQRGGSLG